MSPSIRVKQGGVILRYGLLLLLGAQAAGKGQDTWHVHGELGDNRRVRQGIAVGRNSLGGGLIAASKRGR